MGFIENVNYLAKNIDSVAEKVKKISEDLAFITNDLENIDIVANNIDSVNITAKSIDDIHTYAKTYLGALDKPPTTRKDGTPLLEGDLYYDLNDKVIKVWNGSIWNLGVTNAKTVANEINISIQSTNRFLIYPYIKQSFTFNDGNTLFQTADLNYLISTGYNTAGFLSLNTIIPNYNSGIITGYATIPSPNPGVPLKKVLVPGVGNYVLIFEDGKVYGWGGNQYGQLGLGHNNYVPVPTFITDGVIDGESSVYSFFYMYSSIYLIKEDGTLWVAGDNRLGQLGVGDSVNRNKLTLSFSNEKVIKVNCNSNRLAMLLTDSGKVYVTGFNDFGGLGLGDGVDRNSWVSPTVFKTETGFYKNNNFIDIGVDIWGITTYLITSDGRVFAAGGGGCGQLGDGVIYYEHSSSVFKEMKYPINYNRSIDPIVEVKAGDCCAFFRTKNGVLYSVGKNYNEQLGNTAISIITKTFDNVETFEIIYLSYGEIDYTTVVLKTYDDGFYGIGDNTTGMLGIGTDAKVTKWTKTLHTEDTFKKFTGFFFTKSIGVTMYILTKDGLVYASGCNDAGQTSLYSGGQTSSDYGFHDSRISNTLPNMFN